MNKMLFVNTSDINRINYDFDKNSWREAPRLSEFGVKSKINVCLCGSPIIRFPSGLIPSMIRMTDRANLYTTDFRMKDGFYPLLLDGKKLYFTNMESYSLLDKNWASDNIYSTLLSTEKLPEFESYIPKMPEGWQQGIIKAQNIRVKEFFDIVTTELPQITDFCNANKNANIEVMYSDRYVMDELSLIICLHFIKDLVVNIMPSSFKIKMIGSSFYNVDANDERYRKLSGKAGIFISDRNRDETGKRLINDTNYEFISKPKEEMPHYRELLVKATKSGSTSTMHIMPDAGLAHWGLDGQKCKEDGEFYGTNNGVNSRIPIYSTTEQLFYVKQE